jgi:hypothetical protein
MRYSIRFMEMKEDMTRQLKFNAKVGAYNMVNLFAQKLFAHQEETTIVMLEKQPGPQKWNRGIRSLNKMHEGIIKVMM